MDIWEGRITYKSNGSTILALLSDLHIDAADHDRELLIEDLETAKKLGARISINGDTIDGILPSDRKRHHPSVGKHDPKRDDIMNQIVRQAVDVLSPYADYIDVISPGNHERSILKYHHVDITSMIVGMLNAVRSDDLPPIHVGSYRGFQVYRFRSSAAGGGGGRTLTVFRHHGRGGSAPVTGGALDLDRIRKDFDADLYWIGHKHQSIQRAFSRYSIGSGGKLYERRQRAIMSAGYKSRLTTEEPDVFGDIGDYGEQFYNVSQTGAQWVLIQYSADSNSRAYTRGIRWSVMDSPYPLLQTISDE
jgi:hypothetical protein